MNALSYVAQHVLPATMALLPAHMDSVSARAMLLVIGLQESRFEYRRQISGPACGFWQFEAGGGVRGVMLHHQTRSMASALLAQMTYPTDSAKVHSALTDNDVLACCFARLLLWSLPQPLPGPHGYDVAWGQYIDAWRPGTPHAGSWNAFYDRAWGMVA